MSSPAEAERVADSACEPGNRMPLSYSNSEWSLRALVVGLVLVGLSFVMGQMDVIPSGRFASWISFAVFHLVVVYSYVVMQQRPRGALWPSWKLIAKGCLMAIPFTAVMMFAVILLNYMLVESGVNSAGDDAVYQGVSGRSLEEQSYLLLAHICLLGPLCEEVVFRGFFLNAFRQRMPLLVALVLQAAIFAVIHAYSTAGTVSVFVIGLALGAAYVDRRSLWLPIFMHVFFNTFVMATALMASSQLMDSAVIGVRCEPVSDGLLVVEVTPDSPAAESDLRVGDKIVAVSESAVLTQEDLSGWIGSHKPGDVIPVWFERDGEEMMVEATLVSRRQLRERSQTPASSSSEP